MIVTKLNLFLVLQKQNMTFGNISIHFSLLYHILLSMSHVTRQTGIWETGSIFCYFLNITIDILQLIEKT